MRASIVARSRQGFTLIELLVVVAIIAVLMSLLLPALKGAREQSKIAVCGAKLKGIGSAIFITQSEHNGRYPKAVSRGNSSDSLGRPLWDENYDYPGYTLFWDEWMMVKGYIKKPESFLCPSTPHASRITYYKSLINGEQYLTFATSVRQYGIVRYDTRSYWTTRGIGVDSADASFSYQKPKGMGFRESHLKYAPSTCVAFGDADWPSLTTQPTSTGMIATARNQIYAAIPGYRHNFGGNFVFLDGHVEYAKHNRGVYANESSVSPASPRYSQWFDYIQP